MSCDEYTSPALVRRMYADPARIASRGEFFETCSNRKHSVRGILRMLLAGQPRRAVLDYGCGNGSFLRSILDDPEIRQAYALDIVRHDDISGLPEKATYVDAQEARSDPKLRVDMIFCMNVLYHVAPSEIGGLLQWMGTCLAGGGSLFVTTKSVGNFPTFRKVLDDLGLRYPPEADEISFCVENGCDQVDAVLAASGFVIAEYPLVAQIVTREADEVLRYMMSSRRFSGLAPHVETIRRKLAEKPLFIDTYYETIIHARKPVHDE